MADTAPADELRTAAATLRRLIASATPGPWRTHDTYTNDGGFTATVLAGHWTDVTLIGWLPTMRHDVPWDGERNAWNNAAYIAAMNPTVALALADALDEIGSALELDPDLIGRVGYAELLDVARAINAKENSDA